MPVPTIIGVVTTPLVWVDLRTLGGDVYRFSQADLQLNNLGDLKYEPRILSISPVTREFPDEGGIKSYTWSMVVEDTDGVIRIGALLDVFRGASVSLQVADDVTRRATGDSYRCAGGVVTHARPLMGPKYEFTMSSLLGRTLSNLNREPRIPRHLLTTAEFPGLAPERQGRPSPVCLGFLLEEPTDTVPPVSYYWGQGMVHAKFFGTINLLSVFGGSALNVNVDVYLLSEGAVKSVRWLTFGVRQWGKEEASRVGDTIKPSNPSATPYFFVCTAAGTSGTSEPTWNTAVGGTTMDGSVTWTRGDAFDPLLRYIVPQSIYGQDVFCPFQPPLGPDSFQAATGLGTKYVDYGGRRYTVFFIRNDHPFARAIREGRISLGANVEGLTTLANGTGTVISDPAELLQFVLVNQGFTDCGWQSYSPMPTFTVQEGTKDYIDQASVAAAKAVAETLLPAIIGEVPVPAGYFCGMVLGGEQDQQRIFDFIRDLCVGTGLDVGENRHGQIHVSLENPAAAPVDVFYMSDVIDGSLQMEVETDKYVNRVVSRWSFRYIPSPFPGEANEAHDWVYGPYVTQDATAQTAVGETVEYKLDNRVVRWQRTAQQVANAHLAKFRGVIGFLDGPRYISFTTRWQGLGKTTSLELGSVIELVLNNLEGPVLQLRHRIRITSITIEALEGRVTLGGRLLSLAAL